MIVFDLKSEIGLLLFLGLELIIVGMWLFGEMVRKLGLN